MRNKRSTLLIFLFIIISLSQACIPRTEFTDPIQTEENLEADKTKIATEIIFTKTPKTAPTSTLSNFVTTNVYPEGNWIVTEPKSASIATSLEPVDAYISSDSEVVHKTEIIPTTTSPVSIANPEPTETHQSPEPTPFTGCPNGCTNHPVGCDIKGNISFSTSEKIYHVPGGEYYDATIINPDYGERWFCTEQEAIDNGWRKSKY